MCTNMFVIKLDGLFHHFFCGGFKILIESETNKDIPYFYSQKELRDAGWTITKSPFFVSPGSKIGFVCPECAKEMEKEYGPDWEKIR